MVNAPVENSKYDDDSRQYYDTHTNLSSSSSSSNGNAIASLTPLQLLQGFLKAQATRAGISNELATAFEETSITDNALNKVVEISSMGLLEVMAECEAIINELNSRILTSATNGGEDTSISNSAGLQSLVKACKDVEKLEKQRVAEVLKRLQVLRIAKLNELTFADNEDAQNSTAACMVEQRQQLAGMMAASQTAQQKVQRLVEDINDALQDVREYVADNLPDE